MKRWTRGASTPPRFTGAPKLHGYKHKTRGRSLLVYEKGAIWKRELVRRVIAVTQLGALVQTAQRREPLFEVRIVPKADHYVTRVVYQQEAKQANADPALFFALDPGVNVLATLTSNKPGFTPCLVSGKPIKSRNLYYNKHRARHQSALAKQNRFTSREFDPITTRNRRIMHYLHTAIRRIIDLLVSEGIGLFIVGKNPLWKQEVEMGKYQNQHVVRIPHARFIELLTGHRCPGRLPSGSHRGELNQSCQFLRPRCDPGLQSCANRGTTLQRQAPVFCQRQADYPFHGLPSKWM